MAFGDCLKLIASIFVNLVAWLWIFIKNIFETLKNYQKYNSLLSFCVFLHFAKQRLESLELLASGCLTGQDIPGVRIPGVSSPASGCPALVFSCL